jgi:hypothetical protein
VTTAEEDGSFIDRRESRSSSILYGFNLSFTPTKKSVLRFGE